MNRSKIYYFVLIIAFWCGLSVLDLQVAAVSGGEIAFSSGIGVVPTPTPSPTPKKILEEEGIIRVDTELVNINVRVVDRNGRPIAGLKKGEFTVTEDGERQEIEYFSQSEVPTNYSIVVDNSGSLRRQLDKVI